MNYFLLFLL